MTEFPMTGPGGPGWCPKRSDQATLHEVASAREGTRYVLKHEGTGAYLDLPRGAEDAFVWARLDGERHVGQIAQAFLEEFGSIHSDLGGLLDRLLEGGMLADELPDALQPTLAGRKLTELARTIAMVRIPIPATQPLWRLVGRMAAPLYSRPAGVLAAILGIAGLVLTLGPWGALGSRIPLLEWPTSGLPVVAGIGILLGLNLLVDLFEAVGQVAVLARGGRAPGRIGLSFDVGIPGIYIETPDEILLPLEQRVWLTLSPLLGAALVGGCATIALWRLAPATAGETFLLPLLLQKLAWVAWLRCVVHINPLGPSPLYDALRAWWSLPHLRRLAVRALRGQVQLGQDEEGLDAAGVSSRELVVLAYLGACIVYFVLLARLGTYLLHAQIVPEWTLALETADTLRVVVLALLLMVLGVPTLLALGGGLLMSLQAGLHAMARSDLFPTTGRLALALIAVAVLVSALPRFLVDVFRDLSYDVLLLLALFLAGVATIEGVRLRRESGQGWGALGGPILAVSCGVFTVLLLLLLLNLDNTVAMLGAGFGVLAVALTSISWAGLETARAFRGKSLAWVALLAVAAMPLGMLPGTGHYANPLAGPLLLPAVAVLGLASVLGLGAWLGGRGGARAAGTFTVTLGWIALAGGLAGWWFTGELESFLRPSPELFGGLHLPFLSAALLASGVWLLRRARRADSRLPEFSRALDSAGNVEQQIAACGFVLEGLYMGLRDVFGASVANSAARKLEEADRIRLRGRSPEAEDLGALGSETPEQRAFRYRMAVAAFYRYVRDRSGDKFCERVMARVVGRLPAVAHESIGESAPSTLPVLGAITRVRHEERVRLVRRAVPFTDFSDEAVGQLADWLGLRWYEPGEVIIHQGDVGDCYFLLADGQARVLLEDASGDEHPIATLRSSDGFGEGALLRHEPRSASVVAECTSLVLTLERHVFSAFMQEGDHKNLLAGVFARQEDLRLVREIPLFAGLSGEQTSMLCRRVRPMKVSAGDTVIEQGDAGDRFYLVREGQLEVRHKAEGGEESVVAQLERGDYFGEIALLSDRPRVATVVAKKNCELLALEREDFHDLLGGRAGLRLARSSLERMRQLEASTGGAPAERKDV